MEVIFGSEKESLESVIERHVRAHKLKLTQDLHDFAKSMFSVGRENPFDHKEQCDCPVCFSERVMAKEVRGGTV